LRDAKGRHDFVAPPGGPCSLRGVTIVYRPLRREEIPEAAELFIVAVADLARRHGLQPASYLQPAVETLYGHLFETGVFHVAEDDGRIVGICCGVVRDQIWFLSMFWVLPEQRVQGLGRPLLEQVMAEAHARGARTLCTWSSIDFVAITSYLRLGMMPAGPVLTFSGECTTVPAEPEGVELRPLQAEVAGAIDAVVRGTPRPLDHAFFRAREGSAQQLERDGKPVGYFYASQGVIGPAAWLEPRDAPLVLAAALREAQRQEPKVRLMIPGSNQAALAAALAAGLKLSGAAHFMTSAPFGRLEQYLPSGPGLF
jgi:GNAT superfamily N-acetyltransferase